MVGARRNAAWPTDCEQWSLKQTSSASRVYVVLAVSPEWNRRLAEAVLSLIYYGCGPAFEILTASTRMSINQEPE